MDTFGDLTAADFDHKKWINMAMASVVAAENPETSLTSLVRNLQSALDGANLDVENTFQEVAQSTPRFMREMESVKRNVLLLKDHMVGIQTDFRKMHIDSSETISRLTELDRQRERTKLAADALREANRWSTLVNSRKVLMEGDNVEQLYQLILDMEQSIAYMESIPDFEDRLALLNSTKDRLEALLAPQFMELLDTHGVSADSDDMSRLDALRRLIAIFVAVRRSDVAVRYYTSWFSGRLKSLWDLPSDSSGILLSSVDEFKPAPLLRRVVDFFQSVIHQIDDQLRLQLFPEVAPLPLLRGFVAALSDVSAEVAKSFDRCQTASSADHALKLSRDYLEAAYNFGTSLCAHLVLTEKGTSSECCTLLFDIARGLLTPLSHMAELYGAHARTQLAQLLQSSALTTLADQSSLLTELQHSSTASLSLAEELLKRCIRETRGIALPPLLSAIEDFFEDLSAKWVNAFEAAGSCLIMEDKRAGYAQACGLSSVLTLVSATGSHALALDDFIEHVLSASRALFEWPSTSKKDGCVLFLATGQAKTEETRSFCPFHELFVPLLGETQSGTVTTAVAAAATSPTIWSALCSLSPGLASLLRSPSLGSVNFAAPVRASSSSNNSQFSRLRRVATAVCQGSVSMAIRVAMAPVNDLLSQVPRLPIWSASPGSGDATLPDLAYLPQEYVTQLGQYIFNLPEQLLPFMESAPDLEQPSAENSRGLSECLQRGSPDSLGLGSGSARSRHRSTTSLTPPVSPLMSHSQEQQQQQHAHVIADWLDWLLSGQVSKAFITAILRIQGSSNAGEAVVLTQHGSKQLDADIGYFLGLLEELGLPTPADLLCLRELINCPAASFSEFSRGKPVHLVSAVITLRRL
uniref:Conserved oligomeric Golgi complex subunit 7 n=2 Tax=Schistocephalus solidus TaxID=70667 RepID=A0A0X3P1X3_SCHSO